MAYPGTATVSAYRPGAGYRSNDDPARFERATIASLSASRSVRMARETGWPSSVVRLTRRATGATAAVRAWANATEGPRMKPVCRGADVATLSGLVLMLGGTLYGTVAIRIVRTLAPV